MFEPIIVLALCGVAGGYLIGASVLFEARRDVWARARDVLDAAVYNELDGLNPPYGSVAVDTRVVPTIPTGALSKRAARRYRWVWRAAYAATCNVCSGWWVCAAVLAGWAALAAVVGEPSPVTWVTAGPVLGAAWALHTTITGAGNKLGVWA